MSRLETAVQSLTGGDAHKARYNMSKACNTFGLDVKGFLELTRQTPQCAKIWTRICWHWIQSLADRHESNCYDKRNEQSCYTGYWLIHGDNSLTDSLQKLSRDDFTTVFVSEMANEHRTLQQSFSSLVFAWINYLATEKGERKAKRAVKYMINLRGDRWYSMPMI